MATMVVERVREGQSLFFFWRRGWSPLLEESGQRKQLGRTDERSCSSQDKPWWHSSSLSRTTTLTCLWSVWWEMGWRENSYIKSNKFPGVAFFFLIGNNNIIKTNYKIDKSQYKVFMMVNTRKSNNQNKQQTTKRKNLKRNTKGRNKL